ncbi:hypothetical protein CVT24_005264 [Panaeolus cyanescens]|uniref:Uncharacterized protein n=1 Tax=Panaeolus cyanescens TaxID=181874 RepID=A0A409Y902_9AGAR|nr:hypothetical protein CVT24_005264 [Panaeolus cyanescens]
MTSASVLVKHYAHKAIQTELPAFLEPSPVINSIGVKGHTANAPVETAYMQLAFTENAFINTKEQKYNGISSQRPSLLPTRSARVSSLPNHISEHDPIIPSRRIVSMPDVYLDNGILRPRYIHDNSNDSYLPFEPGSRGDGRRQYIDDLPRTPSPSSPDSIMIIGNDIHVPELLHRPASRNPDWTSWASSPPKPIPALHGPLSLPYARCPSGAEGTVIDGDDLPHKIWGLGLDEAQSQIKTTRETHVSQPWVGGTWTQPDKPFSARYDSGAVIDLIEQKNLFSTKDSYRSVPRLKNSTAVDDLASRITFRPRVHPTQHSRMDSIDLATLVPRQDLAGTIPRYLYPSYDQRGAIPSPAESVRSSSVRLNTAAQVFVPSNKNTSTTGPGSRENIKELPPSISFFAAQHLTHPEAELPTPPMTVSPEWSPVFHYPALPSLTGISGLNKHFDKSVDGSFQHLSTLDTYSPYLDGFDDHAANLMTYMRQIREQELILNRQEPHADLRQSSHLVGTPALSVRNHGSGHMSRANVNVENSIAENQLGLQHTDITPGTGSDHLDRRKNLTSQHPRSIPLARLIQRRLSSVVEEDGPVDRLLPVLRQRPNYDGVKSRPTVPYGFNREHPNNCDSKGEGKAVSKSDSNKVLESDGSSTGSTSSGAGYQQRASRGPRLDHGRSVQLEDTREKGHNERQANRGDGHKKKFKSKRRNDGSGP